MKVATGGAALLLIVAGTISAAAEPTDARSYDWTGFYVGVIGGARQSDARYSTSRSGWLAGAAAGYNAQISRMVIGLEADASYGEIGRNLRTNTFADFAQKSSMLGSLDFRSGIAFDRVLLFAKAGASVADNQVGYLFDRTPFGSTLRASATKAHLGWNAGAGAEFLLTPELSVKGEYTFTRLFTRTYFSNGGTLNGALGVQSGDIDFQSARLGLNYRFAR